MKRVVGFILVFALMLFCFSGCDIEDMKQHFGSKVDIDEALPHYGGTAPPAPASTKVDPDEAMPHYKKMNAR